ncbi:MAG: hypothetical protein J7497_10830, partial [Chitinophagaceae bacterium]|nr:hypothetical protein [Chitinophagaceae bacterium]
IRVELIPKNVIKTVSEKYISDDQKNNYETYFDFLDYHKIIEKHPELVKVFKLKGDGIAWLERLNNLRREPAHPEKPAPSIQDVEYYERVKRDVLHQMEENVSLTSKMLSN